jgi:hypothetical protein
VIGLQTAQRQLLRTLRKTEEPGCLEHNSDYWNDLGLSVKSRSKNQMFAVENSGVSRADTWMNIKIKGPASFLVAHNLFNDAFSVTSYIVSMTG